MIRSFPILVCLLAAGLTASAAAADDVAARFKTEIQPILQDKCGFCHGGRRQKADITLTGDRTLEQLTSQQHLWFRVLDQLEFNQMPPEDEDPLTPSERKAIIAWIGHDLTEALAARQRREGRARFRRLSRLEFRNTFEDLFGYRPDVGLLPQDGRVNGYTKVADALPMSADGAYGYLEVAEHLVDHHLMRRVRKQDQTGVFRAEALPSGQSKGHLLVLDDGWIVSFNSDLYSGRLKLRGVRVPGWYTIRMHVYAYQTDQPLPFGAYVGRFGLPPVTEFAAMATAPPGKPTIIEREVYLDRGQSLRLVPLGLGVPVPKNHQASECTAPGLAVQYVELRPELPLRGDRWLTADLPEDLRQPHPRLVIREKGGYSYDKISREQFVEIMRQTVRRVGARLFRRDLTEQEVEARLDIVRTGLAQERPVYDIFRSVCVDLLTAPQFFCVIESPGELSDFELASRLAYFLWNSTPDDRLLDLARAGRLRDPKVLREQTDRLLDDAKSARFVADFLDQWLELHAIDNTMPDKRLYPEYNDLLKYSSLEQTRRTFERILRQNRSVRKFVAPESALLNGPLAEHYGVSGITGARLRPVRLPEDSPFGGLWTQPLVMKVTANGSNTSPVKRGVFVAERLLGTEISPPPPNIDPINPDTRGATTVREQLALHSSEGACAACHKEFDPYGFALESFDVMGRFRERYRILDADLAGGDGRQDQPLWTHGLPVDPTGVLPDGGSFRDIQELRAVLAERPEQIARGVTRHLLTYATATPTGPLDRKTLQEIVAAAAADDHGLRSIVHGVIRSELFRWK